MVNLFAGRRGRLLLQLITNCPINGNLLVSGCAKSRLSSSGDSGTNYQKRCHCEEGASPTWQSPEIGDVLWQGCKDRTNQVIVPV